MTNPGLGGASQNNAGAYVRREYALEPKVVTAAAGDGTFLDGIAIDRCDPEVALSGIPSIAAKCVLASGNNVVFSRVVQHRENSADAWADYGTQPADVTVVGNNDGSAITLDLGSPQQATLGAGGAVVGKPWNIDLAGAKPQVRLRIKPNFSASGVDTCAIGGSLVLAGLDTRPAAGESVL